MKKEIIIFGLLCVFIVILVAYLVNGGADGAMMRKCKKMNKNPNWIYSGHTNLDCLYCNQEDWQELQIIEFGHIPPRCLGEEHLVGVDKNDNKKKI